MEKQDTKETKQEERKASRGFAIPADSFNPNDRSLAEGAD
jgi:hypothetical protein